MEPTKKSTSKMSAELTVIKAKPKLAIVPKPQEETPPQAAEPEKDPKVP